MTTPQLTHIFNNYDYICTGENDVINEFSIFANVILIEPKEQRLWISRYTNYGGTRLRNIWLDRDVFDKYYKSLWSDKK